MQAFACIISWRGHGRGVQGAGRSDPAAAARPAARAQRADARELCATSAWPASRRPSTSAVLEAANLVSTVRRGREKLHYLNPVPLHEIQERWIDKFERPRLRALSAVKRRAEEQP